MPVKYLKLSGELIADTVAESEALRGGNNSMANKTKQELMDEIKELNKQIDSLKRYDECRKAADDAKLIHQTFVDAGFTEEQAFDLIKISMMANIK